MLLSAYVERFSVSRIQKTLYYSVLCLKLIFVLPYPVLDTLLWACVLLYPVLILSSWFVYYSGMWLILCSWFVYYSAMWFILIFGFVNYSALCLCISLPCAMCISPVWVLLCALAAPGLLCPHLCVLTMWSAGMCSYLTIYYPALGGEKWWTLPNKAN